MYYFILGDREALITSKLAIKQNHLVTTLPILTKEYEVIFEAMPTATVGGWRTVLHLTSLNHGNGGYGGRIPAIFPLGATWYITNAISGNGNFYAKNPVLKNNEWSTFRIKQSLENGKYEYRVYVNGKELDKRVNTQPRDFHEVKVYAGDPWYAAQPGFIKNLYVCGEYSFA